MLAGAVGEKSGQLFEEFPARDTRGVFAHGREHSIDMLINPEASLVTYEEIKLCSIGSGSRLLLGIVSVTGILAAATGP